MAVAGVPALHDTRRAEIDVLHVRLTIQLRRPQTNDMDLCRDAISCQFAHQIAVSLGFGKSGGELADDMTQPMRLRLAGNVAGDPAGGVNILLPVEDLRHGGRLEPRRIPHAYRKYKRALARIVVEHGFCRRIRKNAAVP